MITFTKEILVEIDGKEYKFGYANSTGTIYTLRQISRSTEEFSRDIKSTEIKYHIKDSKLIENEAISLDTLIQFEHLGVDPTKLQDKLDRQLSFQCKVHPDDIGVGSIIPFQGGKFMVTNISIDSYANEGFNKIRSVFGGYTVHIEASSM